MRCPNCGSKVNENWSFCANCGFELRKREFDLFGDDFSKLVDRMVKEITDEMNERFGAFEKNFEVLDLSPFFTRPIKSSGFSIKITHESGKKPKISIKTFGDVNEKEIENEIKKLGFKPETPKVSEKPMKTEERRGICFEGVKITEEPETSVRRVNDKIIVEVKLPGVKDEKNIEVRSLENSIEIKALAGDKAYFKILTKPPQTNVVKYNFKNEVLTLEMA
ncbi:MAG: zinc ribbon domain-containing protein [Candidatus Aenigmatarchaeota archaeon]